MTGNERTPLDAEEQALARRWRALPDGEPPPALDARIRAQAHAAARASRPTVRPWAWGLSTAAAAVLAIGMLWQTGLPPTSEEVMYRSVPGPAPEAVDALLEEEHTAADAATSMGAEGADADVGAAREVAPQALRVDAKVAGDERQESAAGMSERGAPMRKSAAQPMPPRASEPQSLAPPPPPPAPAVAPTRQTVPETPAPIERAPRPAQAPASPPPPSEQDLRRQDGDRERAQSPPRLARQRAGALADAAPAAEDSALEARAAETPQEWIARIDALLEDGERTRALAELRDFVAAHPDFRLPRRLRTLLDGG